MFQDLYLAVLVVGGEVHACKGVQKSAEATVIGPPGPADTGASELFNTGVRNPTLVLCESCKCS